MKNTQFSKRLFLIISLFAFACSLVVCASENPSLQVKKRNIYLDLGAFQGDTLNMFQVMNVSIRAHQEAPWEIFSFEACPLLAHATQLVSDKLNGSSINNPVSYTEIPGMQDFVNLAYRDNIPWNGKLKRLFNAYAHLLVQRISSRGSYKEILNRSRDEINRQLDEAKTPYQGPGNRYTAYAFGVGPKMSVFEMKWHESNYMNGGGNVLGIDYGKPKYIFQVPTIDLSEWIINSFSKDDYIYIKMDIEGMEFMLLDKLITSGALDYINEMDIEWHGRFNVPGRENEQMLKEIIRNKNIILRDHY